MKHAGVVVVAGIAGLAGIVGSVVRAGPPTGGGGTSVTASGGPYHQIEPARLKAMRFGRYEMRATSPP